MVHIQARLVCVVCRPLATLRLTTSSVQVCVQDQPSAESVHDLCLLEDGVGNGGALP
jgi:hypothetical protein